MKVLFAILFCAMTALADNLVTDTFTEATDVNLNAHTADTGESWTAQSGTITVIAAADVARHNSGATRSWYEVGENPANADYKVSAKIVTIAGDLQFVLARATWAAGSPDAYEGGWVHDFPRRYKIRKWVAGTNSTLATDSVTDVAVGDVFRLEVQGSTIRLFVNSVEKLSVTDTSITAINEAGLHGIGGADELDDFSVDDFAAAPAFPSALLPNNPLMY